MGTYFYSVSGGWPYAPGYAPYIYIYIYIVLQTYMFDSALAYAPAQVESKLRQRPSKANGLQNGQRPSKWICAGYAPGT